MEEPITFKNRKNERLFGMLFIPDCRVSLRVGIIISVNAIKYRIGTFRLHTLLARQLCSLGYHVMYFDPAGIGDSEGVFKEKPINEHYIDIQSGKYLEDTIDAVTFFQSYLKLDQLVLAGLCGGAASMLIAASEDDRIDGAILLSIPILMDPHDDSCSTNGEVENITSEIIAVRELTSAVRKLFDTKVWVYIFTFRFNWKNVLRVKLKSISVIVHKLYKKTLGYFLSQDRIIIKDVPVSDHPRFNILLQKAFFLAVQRELQMLFVFADQDSMTWQFKSEFQDHILKQGSPYKNFCDIHILENSNHIYSGEESQANLTVLILNWLRTHFRVLIQI